MSNLKCIFVCGPESAGNRMLSDVLIKAGCFGDADGRQHLDTLSRDYDKRQAQVFEGKHLVWRRSFPHGTKFPNLIEMAEIARTYDREPECVCIVRSSLPTILSQQNVGHVRSFKEGSAQFAAGLVNIIASCGAAEIPIQFVTFEGLIHEPALNAALLISLGLPTDNLKDDYRDANAKHLANLVTGLPA